MGSGLPTASWAWKAATGGELEMGRAGPASLVWPKPRLELERQQADTLCEQGEMWGHEQGSLAGCAPALQMPGGVGRGSHYADHCPWTPLWATPWRSLLT